jgi:hypothetical protein
MRIATAHPVLLPADVAQVFAALARVLVSVCDEPADEVRA